MLGSGGSGPLMVGCLLVHCKLYQLRPLAAVPPLVPSRAEPGGRRRYQAVVLILFPLGGVPVSNPRRLCDLLIILKPRCKLYGSYVRVIHHCPFILRDVER